MVRLFVFINSSRGYVYLGSAFIWKSRIQSVPFQYCSFSMEYSKGWDGLPEAEQLLQGSRAISVAISSYLSREAKKKNLAKILLIASWCQISSQCTRGYLYALLMLHDTFLGTFSSAPSICLLICNNQKNPVSSE